MLLIVEPNEPETNEIDLKNLLHIEDPTPNESEPTNLSDTNPTQISLHALMGQVISQTLKFLGHVNASPIATLIDSGSTHNFIQDRTTKFLGLQVAPT